MKAVVALLAMTLLSPLVVAQDDPVTINLEIFVVNPPAEGETEETFTAATTARPGQLVEYRVTVTNEGDTTLPEGTVVVDLPIPEGTAYTADSATSSETILAEFSANGESYSEPPVRLAGEGQDGQGDVVDPAAYTAIRWTLLEPFEAGQTETLVCRVVVQ